MKPALSFPPTLPFLTVKRACLYASLLGTLSAVPTAYADNYPYFWSVAIADTQVDFGSETNGFGGNNELAESTALQQRIPEDSNETSFAISAGQYFDNYRAYIQYHVRPSDDSEYTANGELEGSLHDIWSLSANVDITTNRNKLISGFIGGGIGLAGVYWEDHKNDEFDDQSLALLARIGFMVNPRDDWFAEVGYRYEKTNLQVDALDNPTTENIDESITLPQVDLKSNSGAYLAIGMNF